MSRSTFAVIMLLVLPAFASLAGCAGDPTGTVSRVSQNARPPQTAKDTAFARTCDRRSRSNDPAALKATSVCPLREVDRVTGVKKQMSDF